MDIRSIMTTDVEVIRPESTLREAAEKMRAIDVGSLPVCDGRQLQGMITDRDITIRAVAEGRDPNKTPVREVMTRDVVYAYDDQAVEEVADQMSAHQIRRVPVVNRNNDLVGIVALGDLAVEVTDDDVTEQVLEDVSTPSRPKRS